MPTVPSLRSVAERILRPHFAANLVEDVGSAPYSLVSDLLKVVNADKLHAIESNSPHIRYETDGTRNSETRLPRCLLTFRALSASGKLCGPISVSKISSKFASLWKMGQCCKSQRAGVICTRRKPRSRKSVDLDSALHSPVRMTTLSLQVKLEAVLERMRGHYKAHVDERATIGKVDGVQLAKRRKLAHSSSSSGEC